MLNPSKFNSYGRLDIAETEIKLLKIRLARLERLECIIDAFQINKERKRDIVKQHFENIKGLVLDKHA